MEGNTTANYINEMFKDQTQLKISRIASGLALGSQLEYADSMTISKASKRVPYLNEGSAIIPAFNEEFQSENYRWLSQSKTRY